MHKVLEILWLIPEAERDIVAPTYETDGSAGMDVGACVEADLVVKPGDIVLIPTGFALGIPADCEVQVRPRSGLAVKHGLTIVNAPGTIDADYRGEVKVGLINLGKKPMTIRRGDRIAQLVVAPVIKARLVEVSRLKETVRGDGGFGHTGV